MTTMKVRLYPYEPIGICEVAGSADTKPLTPASITSTRLFQSPAGLRGSTDLLRNTWHMRLQGRALDWRNDNEEPLHSGYSFQSGKACRFHSYVVFIHCEST